MSSTTDLDTLWRPLALGTIEVPNRIMFSAHSPAHGIDRYPGYLAARARGGAGLIVTGAMPVHPTTDLAWFRAWQDGALEDFRTLAGAVHDEGGTLFTQLHHMGLQGMHAQRFDMTSKIVAPSSVPSPVFDVHGHALAEEEIAEIVEHFAQSALTAKEAGMDGVEIHAAHGYLLFSFLSPLTNRRTDGYGGSVENRARFVIEVLRAVRDKVGEDFPVGLKFGMDEAVGPLGFDPATAAETLRVIRGAASFDYVSLSGAAYHNLEHLTTPITSVLDAHIAEQGPLAREVVGELPVFATCAIRTLDRAAEIVASGKVDMVGMVRPQMADPDLVRKGQGGRAAEIRPCVGANQGCWRRVFRGGQVSCTVNPETGRETEWADRFNPVEHPGRVVVVGGGPAGLKAAESAARRGHEVILLERGAALGGQLIAAGSLPRRDTWHRLVDHLKGSLDRLGVDVRLGTEATAESVSALDPDLVVVATGSFYGTDGFSILRPDRMTIPGLETALVLDPEAAALNPASCGRRVLIVDDHGTLPALGLAELLAQGGAEVELITAHPQVGIQLSVISTMDHATIYPRLLRAGVRCTPEATISQVDGSRVSIAGIYGTWERELDGVESVVLLQNRHPRTQLHDELLAAGLAVELIGDAYAPREVDEAILEGASSGLQVMARV
ncbi:MAG: FAD-dependent oxidoreductase [Actinobacteria bacterium]|nr:FAD-dependent oxidoreductase [Actinomycetota bacterium]